MHLNLFWFSVGWQVLYNVLRLAFLYVATYTYCITDVFLLKKLPGAVIENHLKLRPPSRGE